MITINTKNMMIEHYEEIRSVSANEIVIRMKQYDINIRGESMYIVALSKYEVLVQGKWMAVNFVYDEQ